MSNVCGVCCFLNEIHVRQKQYYIAINASNDMGESTVFIEFKLQAINASLMEESSSSNQMSGGKSNKVTMRWGKIHEYLKTYDYVINADVRELCGVSAATADQIQAILVTHARRKKVNCH